MGWLPDHIWLAKKLENLVSGKGGGKGYGNKGSGKSWGSQQSWGWKGKGKGQGKSYLKQAKAENKVWIGGLPEKPNRNDTLNKKLMEHMKQGGDCKFAEFGKGGVGGAVYKTAAEVPQAIAMLNGSVFEGKVIQVDSWEKKSKN